MAFFKAAFAAYGTTALFVLLWSSGAIFAEIGVKHASAFAFLLLRFGLASAVLALVGAWRGRWLPARGARAQAVASGALLMGGYSVCYFLSLETGLTPGLLATILGVQPILTLIATERRHPVLRVAGLALALIGLASIVFRNAHALTSTMTTTMASTAHGIAFAIAALGCITVGSVLQKRNRAAGADVLPLQNLVGLLMCAVIAPFQPLVVRIDAPLLISVSWLAIVISVCAQLLFYRLVSRGNLVNVTSLFYLVPIVTALMDYVFLGNALHALDLLGMGAILLGLALALRARPASAADQAPAFANVRRR